MAAWLKKWWLPVVALVALLGSFLLGLLGKRRPVVIGENPTREDAEKKADAEAAEAATDRDVAQERAADEHQTAVSALVEAERERTAAIVADEEATNAYLKQTGNDVRGR